MLETIREYAVEQLVRSGRKEAICSCHANYFIGLVERMVPTLLKPDGLDTIRLFGHEQANILAALDWAEANPGDPSYASLGLALMRPWSRLRWSDVYHWLSGIRESGAIPDPMSHLRLPLSGMMEDLGDAEEAIALQGHLVSLLLQQGET